jgi:hypothetical protein
MLLFPCGGMHCEGGLASNHEARGIIDSATTRGTNVKADHYRDTAARLRDMAEGEPIGRLRTLLSDLAAQYEDLAVMFRAR